ENFLTQHKNVPIAMEFWPYGIERSGVNKKDFLDIINKLFNKFYIMDNLDEGTHDITELEGYYDDNLRGEDGLNILLVN
ncbi:MAG: hypothetical protein KAS26_08590, partial [Sulfurimonas sp.]|nr:hypothetical protein [Sulfurimonas sp.]